MNPFNVITTPLVPGTCALIEANAGTGKTFNIQHLYLRLILEKGFEPSRILVVTFTEAATAELRDRIRQNLTAALTYIDTRHSEDKVLPNLVQQALQMKSDDELRAALRLSLAAFDEAAISTIHGFCKRTLDSNAFDSKVTFDCELCSSYADLIRELVTDFYRQELASSIEPAIKLSSLIDHAQAVAGHVGELVFQSDCPDLDACWTQLTSAIGATPDPGETTKFGKAFCALKKTVLVPSNPFLADPDLLSSSAKQNKTFTDALKQWSESRSIDAYARLRDFLGDPQLGFEARKSRRQTMGYDDLLRNMQKALPDPECPLACELRKTYEVALVDEFQDTDPVQYEVFQTVFRHASSMLFMIGDPKQAIYGFRGGDIHAYLKAKEDVDDASRFTLSQNFRSSRELIEAVNHLFAPSGAFAEAGLGYVPSSCGQDPKRTLLKNGEADAKPFEIVWLSGDAAGHAVAKTKLGTKLNKACAAQVAEMLMGKTPAFTFVDDSREPKLVTPGDISVLVTTNRQAEALQKRLRQYNIPAVIYKAGNIFSTEDAKNLWFVLSAMESPNQPGKIKAALLTPWCGKSHSDILALDNNEPKEFEQIIDAFAEFARLWLEKGVMVALSLFLDHFQSLEKIAQDPTCERRLTNFRHLSELLHHAEDASELRPDALLGWLKDQITDPDPYDEAHEQRMESDRRSVTIMTIHKSKGLQFPIVFIPYLITYDIMRWLKKDWSIHDDAENSEKQVVLPVGKAAKKHQEKRRMEENLAEDLRLLYVAVTRAENRCVLLMGNVEGQGARSAVNYLGQLHGKSNNALNPSMFIANPPEAGPTPPFEAVPALTTTTVTFEELGAHMLTRYSTADAAEELEKPAAPPRPADDWAVMSYSGMTQHEHAAPAHMKPDAGTDETVETDLPASFKDDLPGGKTTGLCVHAIFECIDFTKVTQKWEPDTGDLALINGQAAYFGLYTPDSPQAGTRRLRMKTMIAQTLNRVLTDGSGGFTLSNIPMADTRREWDFFFNVPRHIPLDPLKEIGLTFKGGCDSRSGFMTGSIDLLFRRGGRYFFADWKTDTLGDYSPNALKLAMTERNYTFQAIIYAVALHNHLKLNLAAAYDFERHFGGGYYFFVRGITSETGVYEYHPSRAEVENWDRVLREGTPPPR